MELAKILFSGLEKIKHHRNSLAVIKNQKKTKNYASRLQEKVDYLWFKNWKRALGFYFET